MGLYSGTRTEWGRGPKATINHINLMNHETEWNQNFWERHQNIYHKCQTQCFPKDSHEIIWANIESIFFPKTTKIGHRSIKNLYKQRSRCSVIFHLFDPLTNNTVFWYSDSVVESSNDSLLCLSRALLISKCFHLHVRTCWEGGLKSCIPLLTGVYLSKFFFSVSQFLH